MSLSTRLSPRMCVSKKVEANSAGIMVQQEVGDPRGMSAATEGQQSVGNRQMGRTLGTEEQGRR